MKVRDMRKEPIENLPTLASLRPGDVFEMVGDAASAYYRGSTIYIRTDDGPYDRRTYSFINTAGTRWSEQDGSMRVRLLKATLVLEDLGTAS